MKLSMESDAIEQLDREEELAIAAVVKARFRKGDLQAALRTMDSLTIRRLRMREQEVVRRYA